MSDLLLTLYQDDDETPLFTVSTSPTHPHPYLCEPQVYAESELDLQRGSARIGRLDVEIIDPQTGPDQTQRWLTERLGTPEGYSALNGRRVRLEHDDGTVVIDGIVAGVALHNSFAGFRVSIEDIRARGIEIPLFTRTNTTAVLPRGVVAGYGRTAAGQWMVPPATGIIGRYRALEAGQGVIEFPVLRSGDSRRVMHDDIRTAVQTGWDAELEQMVYPTVEVWWRPQGATEWRIHRRMPTPTYTFGSSPDELLQMGPDLIATTKSLGRGDDSDYVSRIFLAATAEQPVLPTTGQNVEVMLVYSGSITERFPLHYEGPAGQLLLDVLRGEYSTDEEGAKIDPRIRVDEARFIGPAAPVVLRAPVRVRITETEEDLRDWFERACQALGIAPALNAHGEVSPVSAELPDETVPLPEINDGNAEAVAGWEHPITDAITQVHVTYHRDISHAGARVAVPRGTSLSGGAADGISSVERSVTIAPDPASGIQQVMGVKVHKVDGFLWRSIGGEEGQGSPALSDDAAVRQARRLAGDLLLRFAHGGQSSFVRVRKSDPDIEGLNVGDWVLDARSWAPNYMSGRRGRNHLAQVVSIRDINPEWREIRLLDAAPHAHPTPQPTLGSLSEPAPGVVAVPVTSVPAGAEARIDYAVSPTLPDTGSGLWTMLDRTRTPRTLQTPPLPTGSTVWIRARGEQVGRRPSAWTPAISIVLSDTALVYRLYVRITESGAVVVSADLSALTQGVRIYYAVHRISAQPPPLSEYQDFAAGVRIWTLWDVVVRPGEAISIELEPWTGWTGSTVSGTAGVRMARIAQFPVDNTAYEISDVVWEEGDDGHGTLSWNVGTEITETYLGYAIVQAPDSPQKWETAKDALTPVTSPVRLPMPFELASGAQLGLVWLQAMYEDPDGNGLATGDIHRMRIFPRTSIPAIDDDTGELARAAIKARKQFAASLPVFLPVISEADLPADNEEADYVLVLETGAAYEWDEETSAWVPYTDTPPVAIYPALTAAIIKAFHIQVDSLAEINPGLGIIISGILRNAEGTNAIRIDAEDSLPEDVENYFDLAATGTDAVFRVGGIEVLANGDSIFRDPVVKTVRYSHHGFRAGQSDFEYISALNNTTSTAPFANFAMPVVLPAGVVIDHMEVRAGRGAEDNMCRITLYRQEITGATSPVAQIIVETNHTGSSSIVFEEEVQSSVTYLLFVETFYQSGLAPSFEWVALKYLSHSYRQTV